MNSKTTIPIFIRLSVFSVLFGILSVTVFPQLDELSEANNLYTQALILFNSGKVEDYKESLDKLKQASLIYNKNGDLKREAACLGLIGAGHNFLGQKKEALEFLNRALLINQKQNNKRDEGNILLGIGRVYEDLGERQKALESYTQALSLSREIGDKSIEATSLQNIGANYTLIGKKQLALDFFEQSLSLNKNLNNPQGIALALSSLAGLYNAWGERRKAIEYYEQALPIARQLRNKITEGTILQSLGTSYQILGEKQKSIEFYNQSLSIFRIAGEKQKEGYSLFLLGRVHSDLEKWKEAVEFYNQASEIFKVIDDKWGQALVQSDIGWISQMSGDSETAFSLYLRALTDLNGVGDKLGEAETLNRMSIGYVAIDNYEEALKWFYRALTVYKSINNKEGEAGVLKSIGFVCRKLNNLRLAAFYEKQAVNIYQELRQSAEGLDNETQKSFLRSVDYYYRDLAETLLAQGRLTEAQQVLNAFKDQRFFDFNRETNGKTEFLKLTERERYLSNSYKIAADKVSEKGAKINGSIVIFEISRKFVEPQENPQLAQSEKELESAINEFNNQFRETEKEFSKPVDEKDKVAEIPDNIALYTSLSNLKKQTNQKAVAVYTLVGEDNFWALIVSPDKIKAVSFPIKGGELNEKSKQLWGLLQSDNYDTTVLSKQIYEIVFKPIEAELPKETTTIMWSLDGNLRYIPMSVLWDGKQFLAERYKHIIFTRADSERLTRNVTANWTGTGFGTSQAQTVTLSETKIPFASLPGVTQELRSIFTPDEKGKTIISGETLSDARFTKENFYQALAKNRPLVHISSHFSFRPGDEARSFLLMGDGSALTLNEIKQKNDLFKGVDLLTLSACNTAAAQADANGREIDGFAELAQRLGAGAVVATLWQVSDASTPWLMKEFYANRQNGAMNKAEALQKAQMSLLKGTAEVKPLPNITKSESQNQARIVTVPKGTARNEKEQKRSDLIYLDESEAPKYNGEGKPKYAHPFYWSPFVLYGNWK